MMNLHLTCLASLALALGATAATTPLTPPAYTLPGPDDRGTTDASGSSATDD